MYTSWRSEMATDTHGDEHIEQERAKERPRSLVAQEVVTLHSVRHIWFFRPVKEMAQGLHNVTKEVEKAFAVDIAKMEERGDVEVEAVDLFYEDFVFPKFRETLLENGARMWRDDSRPSTQPLLYHGETFYFNSVGDKANVMDAAMRKVEEQVDSYLNGAKTKHGRITYRHLKMYFDKIYVVRMESLLISLVAEIGSSELLSYGFSFLFTILHTKL